MRLALTLEDLCSILSTHLVACICNPNAGEVVEAGKVPRAHESLLWHDWQFPDPSRLLSLKKKKKKHDDWFSRKNTQDLPSSSPPPPPTVFTHNEWDIAVTRALGYEDSEYKLSGKGTFILPVYKIQVELKEFLHGDVKRTKLNIISLTRMIEDILEWMWDPYLFWMTSSWI